MFERAVNYYETDRMGVVHHSNYIRYMEEARIAWMIEVGCPYHWVESLGVLIPVTDVEFHYKKGLSYGQTMEVEVRLEEYTGVRLIMGYTVRCKETGEVCGTGRSGHCFVTGDFRPLSAKRACPEVHEILESIKKEQKHDEEV